MPFAIKVKVYVKMGRAAVESNTCTFFARCDFFACF